MSNHKNYVSNIVFKNRENQKKGLGLVLKSKYKFMENPFDYLSEDVGDFTQLSSNNEGFFYQSDYTPGPGEEDEPEEEPVDDEGGDDSPPIDPNIVHSPVPPQTGGKPKS